MGDTSVNQGVMTAESVTQQASVHSTAQLHTNHPTLAPAPPTHVMTTQHQQQQLVPSTPPPPPSSAPPQQHQHMQQVQVIQQPLQNTTYLQQLYNAQGQQLLMPGNIQLHPGSMNPGSIQVIAAGKTFQPNQLTPHMLTAAGYTTIPTTAASNMGNQTLVIGQLGVISSQPNILPAQSGNPTKPTDLQKGGPKSPALLPSPVGNKMQQQTQHYHSQNSAMMAAQAQLLSPLQVFPPQAFGTHLAQGITWAAPGPSHTLLAQNPIYIRGGQPESMFIQSPPPNYAPVSAPVSAPMAAPMATIRQRSIGMDMAMIQPKGLPQPRPLSAILPSGMVPGQAIRPASSVSTQTSTHGNAVQTQKQQVKLRAKPPANRGVAPSGSMITQKADAANQTKTPVILPISQDASNQTKAPILLQTNQTIMGNRSFLPRAPTMVPMGMPAVATPQQIATYIGKSHSKSLIVASATPNTSFPTTMALSATPLTMPMATLSCMAPPIQQYQLQTGMMTPAITTVTTAMSPATCMSTQTVKDEGQASPALPGMEEIAVVPNLSSKDTITDSNVLTKEDVSIKDSMVENGIDSVAEKACIMGLVGGPPKALVKPQVLTHVIEGFVIQEASEPFPVSRSITANATELGNSENVDNGEPPKKKAFIDQGYDNVIGRNSDANSCELCGKLITRQNIKRNNKRFCSNSCAKRFNVSCSKHVGLFEGGIQQKTNDKGDKEWEENLQSCNADSGENSMSPSCTHETEDPLTDEVSQLKINPLKWTVNEVCDFVRNLPGCAEYVEDFAVQEIDGQALMLLKEDHLMQAMSMKLGPALKICNQIEAIRGDFKEK